MSAWRNERNEAALRRLEGALPPIFPQPVLVHARARSLVPPLPRLAIESYWRTHPVRADTLARALAARSGEPAGWQWELATTKGDGRPRSFRTPPAPYRETAFHRGPGHCCICGQPVYRFGWHRDLWGEGVPNRRATWHGCCIAAWKLWTQPITQAPMLRRLAQRRCGIGGKRLLKDAEIDHRTPLYAVWRSERDGAWPGLLRFWGVPNLQATNRPAHVAKSAREAGERAGARRDARDGHGAPL